MIEKCAQHQTLVSLEDAAGYGVVPMVQSFESYKLYPVCVADS